MLFRPGEPVATWPGVLTARSFRDPDSLSAMRFVSLIALLLVSSPLAAQRDSVAAVDSVFARYASPGSPGCACAVARNGRTILERAYGSANLEYSVPNTPATIFEAGSVSKQFTAAAVVMLAMDGRLSLEDPIRRHIPELPAYASTITIRQMLNHTAGLRDWGVVFAAGGWPRGSRVYTHAHVLDVLARQQSLNYTPGAEYLYSNSGYSLSVMIVERLSGKTLQEFMRERIFGPLGMTQTQWRDDFARVVPNRATAYSLTNSGPRMNMPFENTYGHGGLLTTVGDLLKWNQNFVSHTVGGAALVDSMQRRGRLTSGRQITYALGVVVNDYKGVPEVSHTGATAGYRAYLGRFPEQGLSVALLCNVASANPDALGHSVAEIFLGSALRAAAPGDTIGAPIPAADLASRAGTYRRALTNEAVAVKFVNGRLAVGGAESLIPVSATEFRTASGQTRVFFETPRGPSPVRVVTGGDTTRYVPARPAVATPTMFAQYVGTYVSEEAEVTYTVAVDSGKLVIRRRPGFTAALTPTYYDAFETPESTLWFVRDRTGRVTGLSMGMGRVRELKFRRVR